MRHYTRLHIFRPLALAAFAAVLVAASAAAFAFAAPQGAVGGRPGGRGPGGFSGIAIFTALDQDGTPGLSAAEMASAPSVLKALDKNGDGTVSPDELPAFGRGGRGPERGERGRGGRGDEPGEAAPTSTDELTETLMAFDRNGDGKLTRAEVPDRFQGLFDRADTNKDGELTPAELKQSAAAQPPPSQERGRDESEGRREGREGRRAGPFGGGDPLIGAIDQNGDGRLSSDEIGNVPAVLKRFDRNGDGTVAIDEIFVGFGRGRG